MKYKAKKTQNGNWLIISPDSEKVAYFDNDLKLIREATLHEWDWACQNWESENYIVTGRGSLFARISKAIDLEERHVEASKRRADELRADWLRVRNLPDMPDIGPHYDHL